MQSFFWWSFYLEFLSGKFGERWAKILRTLKNLPATTPIQHYHTVLISKICPYFEVLRLRKYYWPYILEMCLIVTWVLIFVIFCSVTNFSRLHLIDI